MKRKHLDKSGKLPAWLTDANYIYERMGLDSVLTVYTPNASTQSQFVYDKMEQIDLMVAILDHLGIPGTHMSGRSLLDRKAKTQI